MKKSSAFLFFFVVALAVYYPTAGGGFVTDEIGWLQNYQATGWKGIFNAFNDKSPHYVYHLVGFTLWKIFGLHGKGWMLFFVLLHAVNATLSLIVFKKLFTKAEASSPQLMALAGGLLFLLSPYQTEPLVWYACVHYLVCTVLVLLAILAFVQYNESERRKQVSVFYITAFLAAFTLEISFSLPFIIASLILFFPFGKTKTEKGRQFLFFVAPSVALVLLYFLATKLLRGNFAGHYGAATHFNMDVQLLMGNLAKYTSKVFALTQFLEYDKRSVLYTFFEQEKFAFLLAAFLFLTAIIFVARHKQLSKKLVVAALLFAMFVFALLPILNLYFSSIVNVEGDRFTYLASLFAAQLVAFSLVSLFGVLGWLPVTVFLFFNVKYLLINTTSWHHNRNLNFSLCEKFKWYDAPHVYLLNLPDNINGTYMFRSFEPDNSFAETLALRYGKDVESKTTEILEYNMSQPSDGVRVEKVSDKELKVVFTGTGNWWWAKGIGGGSYTTDDYEVKIDEWGMGYSLVFKNKTQGAVYLYQQGDDWKQVESF